MTQILGMPLPSHWGTAPLKHVTSLLNRGSTPTYVDNGPVRAIGQAANQHTGLDWERTRFHEYHGDVTKLKGRLQQDDVLINSTGTGTLGRVGYFEGDLDGIPSMADSHVTVARFLAGLVHPRYSYYWMRSKPFQEHIHAALTVGATNQIELNRDRLSSAPLPLPSIEEQRRVANFLDAETALIDRLVSTRLRQLAALEERSNAEVSETLIPDITRSPSGAWPWVWLPVLGEDRPLVRLGYLSRLQSGITVDGSREVGEDSVTRPYLRVANVQAGHVDLSSVTEVTLPRAMAARSTLRPGDVLMTEGGDLDKLGRGTVWDGQLPDCLHQNHVFALRPDPDRLDAAYLALMTQTLHGRCYFESTGTRTTNLASTNSSKIMSFPIPLPSLSHQRELVRYLRAQLDATTHVAEKLNQQMTLLAERRQALITAAVTGQVDVSSASRRGATDGITS